MRAVTKSAKCSNLTNKGNLKEVSKDINGRKSRPVTLIDVQKISRSTEKSELTPVLDWSTVKTPCFLQFLRFMLSIRSQILLAGQSSSIQFLNTAYLCCCIYDVINYISIFYGAPYLRDNPTCLYPVGASIVKRFITSL